MPSPPSLTAKPSYESQLKLLVKYDRTDAVITPTSHADMSRAALTEHDVLSQAELIKSDDLLERVASESGLSSALMASGDANTNAEAVAVSTKALREDLRVVPIKRTWLIDVSYRARDQRTALHVLDTLARLYLEKHLTLHRPSGIYTFFSQQSERAKEELQAAQDRLITFGRENGVVSASLERESVLRKSVEFDALRAEAAAAHLEATQRLSAVHGELRRVPARRLAEVRTSDDAGVTRDIKNRILALETKRAELLRKFTPQYRGVIEVEAQLQEARAALTAAQRSPLTEETLAANPAREWLDTERARIVADDAAARARMSAFATTADRYRNQAQVLGARNAEEHDLLLALQAAEQKYLLYAQKAEEARISDELDRMHVANVVVAQAPTVDYQAKRNPSLATLPLLLVISLLLSVAAAVAVDAIDPNVSYAVVAATSAVQVRTNDALDSRVRVPAVEVEVTNPAEAALQPCEPNHVDTMFATPRPARLRRARVVTLEDLFCLPAPRRLGP